LVGSAAPASPGATPERTLENIAENSAPHAAGTEDFTKDLEGIVESSSSHSGPGSEGTVTKAVVRVSFLGFGKNLIGFSDLLEFLLRLFIPLVFVGMVLDGEFAVCLFDVLGRGTPGYP